MGTQAVSAPAREATAALAPNGGEVLERRELPSGHTLVLLATSDRSETLQIRSPRDEVEVTIVCGPDGPVVSLRSARLELEAPRVAIRCEDFDLSATRSLALRSGDVGIQSAGELRIRAQDDVFINGDFLRLNCTEASDLPQAT